MRHTRLALALVALLGLPGSGAAQRAGPDEVPMAVTMDYADAELTEVIKAVARWSRKNFLYDDRVRGRVTVISESELTVDEAWHVFESILQVKGFTMVEGPGGVLKIIPVREAKEAPLETVIGDVRAPNRDVFITRLVALRYVKADTIVNTFRPLVSKDANVIAYAPTNTMILTDTAANIRRLMTILSEIDVKTYQDQIKVIPVEFADAGQLAQHLSQIFSEGQQQTTTRRRPTRARTQRTGAQAQPAASAAIFGAAGQPRFITDERTNSIIVIAPASTIRQVDKLVTLLDYKRKGAGRIHVYRLQNADAEEMAQTLGSLTTGRGGAPRAGQGAAAAAQAAVAELAGGIRVTADAPTNSLIIQANAEGFATIRDVIEELDIRRPQVMVEALILEIGVDNREDFGAGFLYQNLLLNNPDEAIRIGFGSTTPAADFAGFQTAILGAFVTIPDPAGPAGATIDVPVIQGLITASANDKDIEIVSAPIILTADNEEAEIVVGENIPIPTTQLQTADPSGAGDFLTSQNIERQDVGVTLRVTPQISEGDTVRLEIFQELSEVQEGTASSLGPETSNRQIENTVYVRDGEAVMIGGILNETLQTDIFKVPWLGDIPILGWFFRRETQVVRKTNLLLILTPHIIRDPEDLEKLTIRQRERFRQGAAEALEWTEDDLEQRRRAIEAGIELPRDPNPVRRQLESHTRQYPIEQFPVLEERHVERERERLREMEEVASRVGGNYSVQVALFRSAETAAELLRGLIEQGYDGTVLSRKEGADVMHFVQLGPYQSEVRAQHVAREVAAETGLGAVVVVEP